MKVGIEIEVDIDMIRYRGKTISPAIITLLGQAPEIANSCLESHGAHKCQPAPKKAIRPKVYKVVQL